LLDPETPSEYADALRDLASEGPSEAETNQLAASLGVGAKVAPIAAPAAGIPWIPIAIGAVVAVGAGTWLAWPSPHYASAPTKEHAPRHEVIEAIAPIVVAEPQAPAAEPEAPIRVRRARPAIEEQVVAPEPIETPAPDDRASRLRAEAALMREAQQSLRTNPGHALELAQRHAREFADGVLGEEREVVTIDALLRLGRRPEAERRAAAYLAAHPGSFHARRVERLLAQ
jgi:hypothetical protein